MSDEDENIFEDDVEDVEPEESVEEDFEEFIETGADQPEDAAE